MQTKEVALENLLRILSEQELLRKEILNLAETAQYLGITRSYLYKLTSKNKLPFYRPMGKLIYFKRAELDSWLTRNRLKSEDEIQVYATNHVLNLKTKFSNETSPYEKIAQEGGSK